MHLRREWDRVHSSGGVETISLAHDRKRPTIDRNRKRSAQTSDSTECLELAPLAPCQTWPRQVCRQGTPILTILTATLLNWGQRGTAITLGFVRS